MKVKTIQIDWHEKEAIYSIDFQPNGDGRFATAGARSQIRMWRLIKANSLTNPKEPPHIEFLSELMQHTAAVNVVRFSPDGHVLASAGDDMVVILWRKSETKQKPFGADEDYQDYTKESWRPTIVMKGSLLEIYDLAWSPDGTYIITGSIDNTARIWNAKEGKPIHMFQDQNHYVQGVAWDPLGQYLATQSSDRSVVVYQIHKLANGSIHFSLYCKHTKLDLTSKKKPTSNDTPAKDLITTGSSISDSPMRDSDHCESQGSPLCTPNSSTPDKNQRQHPKSFLYHNENLTSFFRRLSFTQDGALLLTPAGIYKNVIGEKLENPKELEKEKEKEGLMNTVYIFARNMLNRPPVFHLPHFQRPTVAVRSCPQIFQLRQQDESQPRLLDIPHRCVYAVASQDMVMIYDTQRSSPIASITGLHYATLTDLAWSEDGTILLMTSEDGYCSVVAFEDDELGIPLKPKQKCSTSEPMANSMELDPQLSSPSMPIRKKEIGSVLPATTPTANVVMVNGQKKRRIAPTLVMAFGDNGGANVS